MSNPKRTEKQVLQTLWSNAFDAEAERLLKLSPEEMDQEAIAEGIDPEDEARKADEWLAAFERGEIVPSSRRGERARPQPDDPAEAGELLHRPAATQPVPPANQGAEPSATSGSRTNRAPWRWGIALASVAAVASAATLGAPAVLVAVSSPALPHVLRGMPTLPAMPAIENEYARQMATTARSSEEQFIVSAPPNMMGAAPPRQAHVASDADRLRQAAFAACDRSEWAECLHALDRSKQIDPSGDRAERAQRCRRRARAALHLPAP